MYTTFAVFQNPARRVTALAIGVALVMAVGVVVAPVRVWSNLFVAAYFLLTIGLGAAVFVALAYVSGAGWLVAFRRVPESLATWIPVTGCVTLLVLVTRMWQYGWMSAGHADAGTFWFKEWWLTPAFWLIRAVVYVALWSLLAGRLVARSRRQDLSNNPGLTSSNVRLSALFLAVYAVTFTLASVDWIMALEPLWFSTMWGVYQFAGMIQATLAAVIIVALRLRKPGNALQNVFRDEHLHDLGKLLLGFSCFWMYIWFSQYMLIWYANIPEETSYFVTRTHGAWGPCVWAAIMLNWVVPFFVLLPRNAKRNTGVMMKVACVVLIGRWVDLYVMVFPATVGDTPVFGVWEVVAICGLLASAAALSSRSFSRALPIPRNDPYLAESLHYHAG